MKVCFCGPVHWVSPQWNTEGFETAHSLEKGLDGAAAVMSLRSQTERHADGSSGYPMEFQVNVEILRKRKLFLLAPGPVRFGEELTLDTKSYENNLILAQAENAVYMRQAVLEWCVP
jgi:aspartate carbamoyltransferase catalytic subunit